MIKSVERFLGDNNNHLRLVPNALFWNAQVYKDSLNEARNIVISDSAVMFTEALANTRIHGIERFDTDLFLFA